MTLREKTLGELALSVNGASAIFRRYDLDFCCGGKRTLAKAAEKKSLNIDEIEQALLALKDEAPAQDWRKAPLGDIIAFIITRYHDCHRTQLPELILQAEKVERVHAAKASVPKGLARQLTALHEELISHMMKEEQVLFPMICNGMGPQAAGPVQVMEAEHDDAGDIVEVIKFITNNVTPPEEACTTWRVLYNGINTFIDDLMEHISLENNLLFPRALAGE